MSSGAISDAQSLACPRCDSHDTNFCYYNNYSTAQPRHFCKNCKRYWTAGGSLRNVPVGGGLRKSKKSKISKHGKDLLLASPDEFLRPGRSPAPHSLASPSCSTDGGVDEAFAAAPLMAPLLAYRPIFDFTADFDLPGDIKPVPPVHSLHRTNLTHKSEQRGSGLLANGHSEFIHDKRFGVPHSKNCCRSGDQDRHSHAEVSSELSRDQISQGIALSGTNKGCLTMERLQDFERSGIKAYPGARQFVEAVKMPTKQSNALRSADNLRTLSHDEAMAISFSTEVEDEALGNVINVRYPYDWEQVSEVLFGGTPDFFQLPTF